MDNMFFSDWESLLRALIITILGYIALVLAIRISGKRTLSKMNAFDFIVTVALGSCLAAISLNRNITLAEGVLVYATLISLQFIITWLSVRVKKIKVMVSGEPVLLLYKGEMLKDVMKKERITVEEIYLSAREKGIAHLNQIEVMVLETTGDMTVIPKFKDENSVPETLKSVLGYKAKGEV
ncbi:MAG: YetF domain-containing protein, partial [Daejeonella sp.]